MNSIQKFFLILSLIIISLGNSYSSEKVAFIDIDYIIQNSLIGKKMLNEIKNIDTKNLDKLKKKNKILKDLETEINNKKNIISEDAFKAEVVSFRKKLQDFTNEKNQMKNEFNEYKKNKIQDIFKKINPVINEYMQTNLVDILLDKKDIFIGRKEANLTMELLDQINKKIK